ncbi:hypothetical protein ASE07_26890 [Noviherbaspirillum sp. Root189]|nr:hypothetical protein ASE07_26890 [Noviherbaspirillum sp. Root189]
MMQAVYNQRIGTKDATKKSSRFDADPVRTDAARFKLFMFNISYEVRRKVLVQLGTQLHGNQLHPSANAEDGHVLCQRPS